MLYHQHQGEGSDVVLVHGFLGSGKIFEPLTAHLARRFRVTTIDLPGFAGSYDAPVPPTVESLSATVIETIRAIGIKKCSMLGHSLGAWISLEASLQAPELLRRTVLYGGSPDGICPDRFETYEDSIKRIRSMGIESFAAELAAEWFRRGRADPMYPLARAAGSHSSEEASILHVKSWNSWKARDRLGRVSTPTLVVCGDSDRSTHPNLSIEMWQKIDNARLFIVPDAGHIAHLEHVEEFNSLVEKFLQDDSESSN